METTKGTDTPPMDEELMETGKRVLLAFLVLGVSAITLYLLETMIQPVDGVLSSLEWILASQYMMLFVIGERHMRTKTSRLIVSEVIFSMTTTLIYFSFDAWL